MNSSKTAKIRIGILLDIDGNWAVSGCSHSGYGGGRVQTLTDKELAKEAWERYEPECTTRFFVLELELPCAPETFNLGPIALPQQGQKLTLSVPSELELDTE